MRKILIVSMALDIGGVQRSLVSLIQSLVDDNCKVDLLLMKKGGELSRFVPEEVKISRLPNSIRWSFIPRDEVGVSFIQSLGPNLNTFRFIYFLLKGLLIKNMGKARQQLFKACMHTLPKLNGRYDLAIDYQGIYKSLILYKTDATKKVSWVHGDYRPLGWDRALDEMDFLCLDAIVTVSPTCQAILMEEFPQHKNKCLLMQNISNKRGIIRLAEEPIDFDEDFKGIRIVGITRLDRGKGLEIAIGTCEALVRQGYNIRWYILGDGSERAALERDIADRNLSDHFLLLGNKVNPYPYVKRADMIVHSSFNEGRSVAIDEAMLLAKPIVLTDYPTAKDQITSGVNGIICEISIQGVTDAVKNLIDNLSLQQKLVKNLADYDINAEPSLSTLYQVFNTTSNELNGMRDE